MLPVGATVRPVLASVRLRVSIAWSAASAAGFEERAWSFHGALAEAKRAICKGHKVRQAMLKIHGNSGANSRAQMPVQSVQCARWSAARFLAWSVRDTALAITAGPGQAVAPPIA